MSLFFNTLHVINNHNTLRAVLMGTKSCAKKNSQQDFVSLFMVKILAQDFQMAAFTKILGWRDKSVVPLLST